VWGQFGQSDLTGSAKNQTGEAKRMRQQTGSRSRGWLSVIGNRLPVAAGVALAAGMLAGTAYAWSPALLASGGDSNSVVCNRSRRLSSHGSARRMRDRVGIGIRQYQRREW